MGGATRPVKAEAMVVENLEAGGLPRFINHQNECLNGAVLRGHVFCLLCVKELVVSYAIVRVRQPVYIS